MITSLWILLGMRSISDNFVDKIKTHILCPSKFLPKIVPLKGNMEKYGRTRQAADDNITRRMRFACWITKATDANSELVTVLAFPRQQ
jgi:hypothetical protein